MKETTSRPFVSRAQFRLSTPEKVTRKVAEDHEIVEKSEKSKAPTEKNAENVEMIGKERRALEKALDIDRQEFVMNGNRFPDFLTSSEAVIIVVQVHDRANYFRYQIESLKSVRDIDKALLIISHDYYSDEMNKLVKTIDFCRVVQIFYPYSMQFYPDKFPGEDPNDCPRDITKAEALRKGCNNAAHPDQYNHYREARYTMIKHHWWWKISHIFDGMRLTRTFDGFVLFLEEDHYVSPDLISMLNKMSSLKSSACSTCDFIGLGIYDKISDFRSSGSMVHNVAWEGGKHNMGFAMKRDTWNSLKSCTQMFCEFDDYNWDWTLQSLGKRCLGRPLSVLLVSAPRVFHIGKCGTHKDKEKTARCDALEFVDRVKNVLERNSAYLFPTELKPLSRSVPQMFPRRKEDGYGGWGDIRDHQLCASYIQQHPRQTILTNIGNHLITINK